MWTHQFMRTCPFSEREWMRSASAKCIKCKQTNADTNRTLLINENESIKRQLNRRICLLLFVVVDVVFERVEIRIQI